MSGWSGASGPGGVALVFGVGSLRPGGSVRTEAIQEHRVLLVDVGAAVVLLRRALLLARLGVLAGHAGARPRVPAALGEWAARGEEQRIKDPTRSRSVYPRRPGGPMKRVVASPFVPFPEHPNTSPPEPSGPRYSARVALSCERGHAPGQVLHALQGLRSVIDDRLRSELGGRYDRHTAASVGTDKLTVTFTLRADTHADAIRSAGLAAGTLAELLADNATAVDLSGVALVLRAL
jgi:hypothetical protein